MNVLSLILTSSKIDLLKRGIRSIEEQQPVSFKYILKIVVNTLDNNYYNLVCKTIGDKYEVIRTKSNGTPGKGHNSLLQIFKDRPEFTHMTMLDGDDMYYPCAFQQIEKMIIKFPDMDLLHLMINDSIKINNTSGFNDKILKHNFRLISSFNNRDNWWKTLPIKSPLIKKIYECKTPSRIIICNRKVFGVTNPISYSENMELYDDFICFFSFYEAFLRGELKSYSTSDTNIYLYNALNDNSVTHKFARKDREQKIFLEESKKYTNVWKSNWQIKDMPFAKVSNPEKFNINDKINFCNTRVINMELINIKYRLNNLDKEKSLYMLFKLIIGIGIDTEDNIRNMIICCIKNKRMDDALKYLNYLFKRHPSKETIEDIFNLLFKYNIFEKCVMYYEILKSYGPINKDIELRYKKIISKTTTNGNFHDYYIPEINFNSDKDLFCYFTGYTDSYNGANYGKRAVYGSEIAAIKLCEQAVKKYNSIVFCTTDKIYEHNGVFYMPHNQINKIPKIKHFIISRYIGVVCDIDFTNIENIYYIMHDARVHEHWRGGIKLPGMGLPLFNNFQHKFKKMIFVSEWQKDNFLEFCKKNGIEIDESKICIIGNGINIDNFKYKKVKKKNNRFIYCSDPSRGLHMLCEILTELQKIYKDITLDIYFGSLPEDIRQNYVNKYNWIKFNGKIPNEQMSLEFSKSDFWLYPNINSHETFCISCIEAMCGGNVVITRDFSALPNLVKDKGFLIPEDLKGNDLKNYTVNTIRHILDNNMKEKYQKLAHNESLKYDWSNIFKQWLKILN